MAAFSRCLVIKCRVAPFKAISADRLPDSSSGFFNVVILRQIGFLILKAAEPTPNHDVVSPTALAIHALTDSIFFYKVNVLLACKLTALIRIQNLWFSNPECLFKGSDTEIRV